MGYLGSTSLDQITDEQVKEFQRKADPAQASLELTGLKLNAIYALPSIGFVLAAIAFLLVGPLIALKPGAPTNESTVWVMGIGTQGRPGLELVIYFFSCLWAAIPLVVAIVQFWVSAPLPLGIQVLRWASIAAVLFAAVVFFRCAGTLRSIRNTQVAPSDSAEAPGSA